MANPGKGKSKAKSESTLPPFVISWPVAEDSDPNIGACTRCGARTHLTAREVDYGSTLGPGRICLSACMPEVNRRKGRPVVYTVR